MGRDLVRRARSRPAHDRQLSQRAPLPHPAPLGCHPLNAITVLGVNKWIADLHQLGYANSTVATIIKVLSMSLTDAADEGLIPTNPVRRRRRRGRRRHRIERERVWATPAEVLRITEQAAALRGETAGLLIITAAWTGCRWGELTGLRRDNIDLDRGILIVDPHVGALHESAHTRWIGSPKTASLEHPSSVFRHRRAQDLLVQVPVLPEGLTRRPAPRRWGRGRAARPRPSRPRAAVPPRSKSRRSVTPARS